MWLKFTYLASCPATTFMNAEFVLYLTGLKLFDPTKASVFAIIEPLTAAVLGFLFLQERLSYESIVGFTLIISSIILLTFQK